MTTSVSSLKVVDLKAALREKGLPTKGLKAELVQRLSEAISADAKINDFGAKVNVSSHEEALPQVLKRGAECPCEATAGETSLEKLSPAEDRPRKESSGALLQDTPFVSPVDRTMHEYVLGPSAEGPIRVGNNRESPLAKRRAIMKIPTEPAPDPAIVQGFHGSQNTTK